MATKHWVADALSVLAESLAPVPHESNELDWKATLSANKDRLAEHLMAMANLSQGGCLVFGINDDGNPVGIDADAVERIVGTLANLGREAIEPPIALDHSVNLHQDVPVLLVRIPSQAITPVHRRGKSVEETWIRSAGTTRKASRQEVSVYPEIALRELIANALIHQDFTLTGAGPMVDVYSDRISITNPGTLLPGKRPDRLIGTTPESRNEKLAASFRRYRICEERGTGFQKVVTAIELFGMPPLRIEPHESAFRVTLSAPRKFADMANPERLEACYQHAVLQYLSSQTLTNTTLRERFKLHDKQRNAVTNLIADAVEAGRIKRKDGSTGNKFAEYVPYWA